MELLDAALAFALTLAALATVVTVIMEIVLRSVLMRKKNLVQVSDEGAECGGEVHPGCPGPARFGHR